MANQLAVSEPLPRCRRAQPLDDVAAARDAAAPQRVIERIETGHRLTECNAQRIPHPVAGVEHRAVQKDDRYHPTVGQRRLAERTTTAKELVDPLVPRRV